MSSYSIEDAPAGRVVDVTRREGAELNRLAAALGPAMDSGAAAAGPGSPVAAALTELRAAHDRLAADQRRLVDSATAAADRAIAAYVTADRQMAQQYGPFPVAPGHPVLPDLLDQVLRQHGFPTPPPR